MIRKFYDAGTAEAGAAATRYTIGEQFSGEDLGIFTEEKPVKEEKEEEIKPEKKQEVKPEDVKEEKKVEEKTVIQDWRELIRNPEHQKEVYNLLGVDEKALSLSKELQNDEFVQKLVTYRKQNGNLTPFIEAATKDWDNAKHEDLVMQDLIKQYPENMPLAKRERLAKADFNERFIYKEDPNLDETENKELAELKELKLESEAEKIRAARKTEQQQFLDSIKPVDTKAETERLTNEKAEADLKELTAFKNMVEANPETTRLLADKTIVLGKNGSSHNYPVNPEVIREQTFDSNKFYGKFWKQENGKPPVFDVKLWTKVVAYSENPEAFENFLIEKASANGVGKFVEKELENATEKTSSKTEVKKESLGKAVEKGQPFNFND